MSTNDNTSTLKSYIDSATGAVQNAVGSLIGSTGDQVCPSRKQSPCWTNSLTLPLQAEGQHKQNKAEAENDASHATAKLPGFTATASGVAKDDPNRTTGSWNQTVGSAKETVGGVLGSEVSSNKLPDKARTHR